MPNGTLTKKIQRQPTVSVRSPPSTGPSAGATSVGIITIVAARARSIGGKARNIIATPTGVSIPPPIPCTIRNAISWPIDWAKPHIIEPITNRASAVSSTRFVPKRSPNQPLAGIQTASESVYPRTTQSMASVANSSPIVRRATLTIVTSRMSRNSADTKTAATTNLYSMSRPNSSTGGSGAAVNGTGRASTPITGTVWPVPSP